MIDEFNFKYWIELIVWLKILVNNINDLDEEKRQMAQSV